MEFSEIAVKHYLVTYSFILCSVTLERQCTQKSVSCLLRKLATYNLNYFSTGDKQKKKVGRSKISNSYPQDSKNKNAITTS